MKPTPIPLDIWARAKVRAMLLKAVMDISPALLLQLREVR